jgi:hypothetical protein
MEEFPSLEADRAPDTSRKKMPDFEASDRTVYAKAMRRR